MDKGKRRKMSDELKEFSCYRPGDDFEPSTCVHAASKHVFGCLGPSFLTTFVPTRRDVMTKSSSRSVACGYFRRGIWTSHMHIMHLEDQPLHHNGWYSWLTTERFKKPPGQCDLACAAMRSFAIPIHRFEHIQ